MLTEDGWDPNDMMNGSYDGGAWVMVMVGLLLLALAPARTLQVHRSERCSTRGSPAVRSARRSTAERVPCWDREGRQDGPSFKE